MCQTSSIDFLISQNFDFNKLFKEGIPYLRPSDEEKLRSTIKERQTSRKSQSFTTPNNSGTTVVPEEQKDFINKIHDRVEKWLKDSNYDEKMLLDSCNPFQRRLIYSTVKPRFSEDYSFHMETVCGINKG